jgi:DNA-binding XRE family transcriptional regulator
MSISKEHASASVGHTPIDRGYECDGYECDVRCAACGGRVLSTDEPRVHTEVVGTWRVKDTTRNYGACAWCDTKDMTMLLDVLHGYELRAARAVLCAGGREGAVAKYARKALGLTQKELGVALGYRKEAVCRWETETLPLSQATALALLALVCCAIEVLEVSPAMAEPKIIKIVVSLEQEAARSMFR